MPAKVYTKEQIEASLAEKGLTVMQETNGLRFYQSHTYPGHEIILDWSTGQIEWDDFKSQLDDSGIDSQSVYNYLEKC